MTHTTSDHAPHTESASYARAYGYLSMSVRLFLKKFISADALSRDLTEAARLAYGSNDPRAQHDSTTVDQEKPDHE